MQKDTKDQNLANTDQSIDCDRILLTLKFEARSEFSNLAGKHFQFSEFMIAVFSKMPYFLSPPLQTRWREIKQDFNLYHRQSRGKRKEIASRAYKLIHNLNFVQKLHFYQISEGESGLVFSGMDLRKINAHRLDLKNADFSNCDLRGAYFCYCNLQNANFTKANLKSAIFTRANLIGAIFEECKKDQAIFDGAIMEEADYAKQHLERQEQNLTNKYPVSDLRGGCYHSGNHVSISDSSIYY
ncbi:MAG: hypothetical protein RLZZ511_3946 [Cyanobacteriota bacterium]|jgi:hypothetical protein